jgi:sulfane dehydrogenase subunit SoxC
VLLDRGYHEITGLAWSGRGRVRAVDISTDGGITWSEARLQTPVMDKCLTRFRANWIWDGRPAILQSRATDVTDYVQPTLSQLRTVRGTRSIYHNNAIQSWRVNPNGEVDNVQVG